MSLVIQAKLKFSSCKKQMCSTGWKNY